ncbi:MAG: purine-nucleoside phosphorylase [Bacteroidales bacterium]|nr:purine-nucleoside phosphorylase [Bacteroidales bacterium]
MLMKINETSSFLQSRGITCPETGIILGTGLGNLIKSINIEIEIDYKEIPHFPVSTVESHHGKLIYGVLSGKKVLAMQGRFHYYEGYAMQQITFPVRVMKFLGVKHLLVSNACGTVNKNFSKGELMLITDHINLLGGNPLIGENFDELGPRFPDMSQPYATSINKKIIDIAEKYDVKLNQGVYAAVAGPNLETRAEYRYMAKIGADVIGMSTIPEVLVANHMNIPVAAISVITDECDPDNLAPVNIKEILAMAGMAEKGLNKIFTELVKEL